MIINKDEMSLNASKSQKHWQATIDAVKDYIFVVDRDHNIRKANISFAARFGKHPRDIIGINIDSLVPFHLPYPEGDDFSSTEATISEEINYDDNTYVISAFPAKYDDDEVCVFVMKDITEIIHLKNKLHHSYKLASLGLLVSGVAHEINNPLTGILGYTELLSMKTRDETLKKELEKIYKAAERCKIVVESLLCFSRQQQPQKTLEYINSVLDRTIDLRAYWFRNNNIDVERDYDRSIPLAYIDSQQIQQVILNIFMNSEYAIAESGRKGKILIKTSHDKENNRIYISISDNGTGIPPENIEKIFDPFFTTKPLNKGTGLGLSISYGIISEHGGTIKVESNYGEGATFIIELPFK